MRRSTCEPTPGVSEARASISRYLDFYEPVFSDKLRGSITQAVGRNANDHGLSDWTIMPGRVPHEEVESWYSVIDIGPFARKLQPVTDLVPPLKPIEAMPVNEAVLASPVRALAEFVIDGETGLIFRKGEIADLTEKLSLLIRDSDLRRRLSARGREWVIRERT